MRRLLPLLTALFYLLAVAGSPSPLAARAALGSASYPPGWNIVGGPAGTQLAGISGSLYTRQFRDSSYQTVSAGAGLTGGLGYWAYFPAGGQAMLTEGGPCVIAVPIGANEWVLVGNASATGTSTVKGAERVYRYDPAGGYTAGVTLKPGQGAWAFSSVATTVALVVDGCPTADSVPPSAPVPPP